MTALLRLDEPTICALNLMLFLEVPLSDTILIEMGLKFSLEILLFFRVLLHLPDILLQLFLLLEILFIFFLLLLLILPKLLDLIERSLVLVFGFLNTHQQILICIIHIVHILLGSIAVFDETLNSLNHADSGGLDLILDLGNAFVN